MLSQSCAQCKVCIDSKYMQVASFHNYSCRTTKIWHEIHDAYELYNFSNCMTFNSLTRYILL